MILKRPCPSDGAPGTHPQPTEPYPQADAGGDNPTGIGS
jgi:hypothetical protein